MLQHLQAGFQYLRSADGKLEGLACVHVGCDHVFVDEADWRQHVFECAHHGILKTPREDAGHGESDDDVFEQAWMARMRSS